MAAHGRTHGCAPTFLVIMMKKHFLYKDKKDLAFFLFITLLTVGLFFLRTGFEPDNGDEVIRAKARVISTDDSNVKQFGIVKTGQQILTLELINTQHKGEILESTNQLIGKMELDKFFAPDDIVYVSLELSDGEIEFCNIIDHYRIPIEIVLLGIFLLFLVLFAGFTGIKAIVSFMFTGLCIWKILLPGFLKGYDPIWLALFIVSMVSFAIVFLVGGLTKKGLTAFFGTVSGVFLTCVLSIVFGRLFRIHGAIKPFSETLLYSGYPHLDLSKMFLAGIFIASSGAVMDIAMDIASSQREVLKKHPEISRIDMIKSGFNVGRAVIGTMTTTLLLAYSGSYTALLMVFLAQRVPTVNLFNITYVASEILHTLVGSFGLVTVAPLTAIIGGILYCQHPQDEAKD